MVLTLRQYLTQKTLVQRVDEEQGYLNRCHHLRKIRTAAWIKLLNACSKSYINVKKKLS